jgi:hypothetical protein
VQISEGGFVGRDHSRPRTSLDRHVADRHAAFHAHVADGAAGVLDDMPGAAIDADACDDGKDDVLGRDPEAQLAVDRDAHGLLTPLPDGLRRHHVHHLGGANSERDAPEGAMRGRVRIRPADQQAWLRDALLGRHDVQDALTRIVDPEQRDAVPRCVGLQLEHHVADLGVRDSVDAFVAPSRRHVMVGEGEQLARTRDAAAFLLQFVERVRSALVNIGAIDVQQQFLAILRHDVTVPDFLDQRLRCGRRTGTTHAVLLQLAVILASRTTCSQRSRSFCTKCPNSAGVDPAGSAPCASSTRATSGVRT